jgi:hypothetical protein
VLPVSTWDAVVCVSDVVDVDLLIRVMLWVSM